MNFKALLREFMTTFGVTLVVAAIVSFLYSLIAHGTGTVDWGTSFRLAIILGIVLPWMGGRARRKREP
ncbi:hypothetical protein ACFL4U_03625 [Candidatus Neomarinimicrobiota bacterium]